MAAKGLHVFDVGVVAVDKEMNSHEITVIATGNNHMFNDEVSETEKESRITSKDGNGTPIPMDSKTSQTLTASWLAMGSGGNRVTPPNVRKGEAVTIWRYGDTNDYYWEKHYTELELRRLEEVLYLFGGTSAIGEKLTTDNSYWTLISTIGKLIQLHTSRSNGEPFGWDFKIDTARGVFSITDNVGITYTLDASTGTVTTDSENAIIENTKSSTENTETKTINASSSTTIDTPETTVTGNESVGGNLTVAGGLTIGGGAGGGGRSVGAKHSITGDMVMIGDIDQNGNLNISGNINCANLVASGTVSGSNI